MCGVQSALCEAELDDSFIYNFRSIWIWTLLWEQHPPEV